jgi:hypothetical protein
VTASGAPLAKPNVLVQYCQISEDRSDIAVNGNPSMYTKTVGTGRVVLFRDGKRLEGNWSRASLSAPTTFTDAPGEAAALRSGRDVRDFGAPRCAFLIS